MGVKETLKSVLQGFGLDIVRYVPELDEPFAVLPYLVRERLARKESFFFIQVGANDGIIDDPIRDLIFAHRLPGLMIEPLPDMFEKLRKTYAGHSQLAFENVAISDKVGAVPLFRVKSDANVPKHHHGLASFFREHLLKEGVKDQDIAKAEVQSVKFESILAKHGIKDVTLLQIDTEGYDCEIIKLALAAGMRPEMINYEHCHLLPKLRHECKTILDKHGYQFLEVGKDTLAVKKT